MNEVISTTKRVAVVGATGYAGAELTAILARHRGVELVGLYSSSGGASAAVTPSAPTLVAQPFTLEALLDQSPDVTFLATPNEVSATLAPQLLDHGIQVIDLSGAFRLGEAALYPAQTDYLYYVREPSRDDGTHNFYINERDFALGVRALRNWEQQRDSVTLEDGAVKLR